MELDPAHSHTPPPIAAIPVASDPPTLHYASTSLSPARAGGVAVTVGTYPNDVEAAMHLAMLEAEGIIGHLLNANVNSLGPYSGWSQVELQVHAEDAARAKEILDTSPDELVPAEQSAPLAAFDEEGHPLTLDVAADYENVRQLRDAHAVLAAGNVRGFLPKLLRRDPDAPPTQTRFELKVARDDLERAHRLLREAAEDDRDDDQPHCPRCKSWRVYPVGRFWKSFRAFWGIGKWPAREMECLACRYRGAPAEFDRG